jgi:hypothetical protein
MEALPTWEGGIFSKILRESEVAREQHKASAAALWESVFGDADKWFDPNPLDAAKRPTEFQAIKSIFFKARHAQHVWNEWLNMRDESLYTETLDELADNVKVLAVMKAAQEAKEERKREVKRIRESQLPLPLGVAA